MYRRISALLLSLGMMAGIGVVAASPAAADSTVAVASSSAARTHTCVDNYEWNNFYIGDGKNAVERLFDTRGWWVWNTGSYAVKKYTHCGYVYDIVKVKYYWNGYRWLVYDAWRY
jgi:hypothetical protein